MYLVWSDQREDLANPRPFDFGRDLSRVFRGAADEASSSRWRTGVRIYLTNQAAGCSLSVGVTGRYKDKGPDAFASGPPPEFFDS